MCLKKLNYDRKELERRREHSQHEIRGKRDPEMHPDTHTHTKKNNKKADCLDGPGFLQTCWCGATSASSAGCRASA